MTEGSIVADCWGELFYITPGLALELGFDGPQGFPLSFHTELSVAMFLGTLSSFDLALLNQRFSPKAKHSYKDIQSAIMRGRLHVFPMDAPIALASSVLAKGRPNQSTAAQSQNKEAQSRGFKSHSAANNGLECVNRTQKIIRSEIRNTLRQIIEQERLESRQIERDYKRKSAFEKTGAHIQKFRKGLHQATASFLTWVKDVNDVMSINQRLLRTLMAVQVASHVETDNRYELFQKTLSILEKKEIVDVLGFDPSLVTTAQITEVYSLAKLVYDDHATRLIITHFAHDYIKAQHQLEWSEFSGGASFEIILTAFLAVVTGGVGAIASLGAQARKLSQLKKLGELFSELAELLKKAPKNKGLSLREQKALEDRNYKPLAISQENFVAENRSSAYGNTTKNSRDNSQENFEEKSQHLNKKPVKYSNVKSMDPEYIAEELGMAKAWEPFGAEVKYLSPEELAKFEVRVVNNKLVDIDGSYVDSGDTINGKVMFVMDPEGKIYVGEQRVMEFHHSSFLAGKEIASAGELMIFDGEILSHSRRSGHYKPSSEQHKQFISQLNINGIDLSLIPEEPVD